MSPKEAPCRPGFLSRQKVPLRGTPHVLMVVPSRLLQPVSPRRCFKQDAEGQSSQGPRRGREGGAVSGKGPWRTALRSAFAPQEHSTVESSVAAQPTQPAECSLS